jgi:hypothetical protein
VGHPPIAMPHQSRNLELIRARARKPSAESVAQIVEANMSEPSLGPGLVPVLAKLLLREAKRQRVEDLELVSGDGDQPVFAVLGAADYEPVGSVALDEVGGGEAEQLAAPEP